MTPQQREEVQKQQAQYEAEKVAKTEARNKELLDKDYSGVGKNLDELYAPLSVPEIKMLTMQSESFRNRVKDFDGQAAVADAALVVKEFRAMTQVQRDAYIKTCLPWQRAAIDADYDKLTAMTPEEQAAYLAAENGTAPVATPSTPVPTEAEADAAKAAALQAEADRLAAEAAASGVRPTVPKGSVEELYDGVEKLGDGSYKLTVDPGDGTPTEIFYGASQKECFQKLRKSKANATKELRRRRNAVKITDDLKGLGAETVDYPPLIAPVPLTPDEIFTLTKAREKAEDDLSDPVKVLSARKRLREIDQKLELASLTPEECEKLNAPELQRRFKEQRDVATLWMRNNPTFYPSQENIQKFQEIMSGLNWAVTIHNMDLAFKILKDQDALSDPPEDEDSPTTVAQPASVVPVATVPPTPAAAVPPAPSATPVPTPAAPSGVLPETPTRVLRPASSSTGILPTRRTDSISHEAPKVVLTAEMYNSMPASDVKLKYHRDPLFKAAVDKLITEGKI